MEFVFDPVRLREVIRHTQRHPLMRPLLEHLIDEKFWKPGTKPDEHGFAKADDIDISKIEPCLLYVKDRGIYMLSGSSTTLPDEVNPTHHFVVYADGYGPDADWQSVQDAAGGDDFAESIPLSHFLEALDEQVTKVVLRVTEKYIQVIHHRARKQKESERATSSAH